MYKEQGKRGGRGGRELKAGAWALVFLWGLWVVGYYARDATWLTGLCFFIPTPVVCGVLAASAWKWRRSGRGREAVVLGWLGFWAGFFMVGSENKIFPRGHERPRAGVLRLVHWNVNRGDFGWDGIESELRAARPDLCVLSEVPGKADVQTLARRFGADFSGVRAGNMAVVARGTLHGAGWLSRHDGVKIYGVIWTSPSGECRVMAVDLPSNPLLARAPMLGEVRKWMLDWHPDIVVGDFNAPRRSRALSPLPEGYAHAYEAVGFGWSYTWPVPCPVYAIDQCIAGARIRPVDYSLESSWRSDHRRQIFEFTLGGPPMGIDSMDGIGVDPRLSAVWDDLEVGKKWARNSRQPPPG